MKKLRTISIILLIFNGISGIAGGAVLGIDPSGSSIQMPLSLLEHSPFNDFLIPGILLFTFNGVLSLFAALAVIRRYPVDFRMVALQGIVSTVWIVTQVIMIQAIAPLHFIYGGIGLLLLVAGIALGVHAKRTASV